MMKNQYPDTPFLNNVVEVHQTNCACANCDFGYSIRLGDTYDEYLAQDVAAGRGLVNRTGQNIAVRVTKDVWDTYVLHLEEEALVFADII